MRVQPNEHSKNVKKHTFQIISINPVWTVYGEIGKLRLGYLGLKGLNKSELAVWKLDQLHFLGTTIRNCSRLKH